MLAAILVRPEGKIWRAGHNQVNGVVGQRQCQSVAADKQRVICHSSTAATNHPSPKPVSGSPQKPQPAATHATPTTRHATKTRPTQKSCEAVPRITTATTIAVDWTPPRRRWLVASSPGSIGFTIHPAVKPPIRIRLHRPHPTLLHHRAAHLTLSVLHPPRLPTRLPSILLAFPAPQLTVTLGIRAPIRHLPRPETQPPTDHRSQGHTPRTLT